MEGRNPCVFYLHLPFFFWKVIRDTLRVHMLLNVVMKSSFWDVNGFLSDWLAGGWVERHDKLSPAFTYDRLSHHCCVLTCLLRKHLRRLHQRRS
jgi:hypothetical protein